MPTQTQPLPSTWIADGALLQCVTCGGALGAADDWALTCAGCGRSYPIRDGILDTMGQLQGNNKVAADFYNGPLWPRFRFWEWFTFLCNGGERRARRQITKHLPNLSGTRLLEVAIGDGSNLPLIPADCLVYGNDISIVQLEGCRRRFPDRDLRLLLGEAESLPFRDRTFDNVLSVGAFNYFNDPLRALREMARVCRPGGWVVVADEVPNLPNRLIGHRIGLPQLDRWIMARLMHLGPEFTDMVDRHRNLQLEPIVKEVLDDWQIHSLWFQVGYCIVGRPKA
ncbi:MAG TPA: methyltransferase domain-containing protein [Gemmataceae bacterium]|nr:methyltransferase domain-containing protein [Gemmataceae bacterium]